MGYGILALGLTSAIGYGYRSVRANPMFAIRTLNIEGGSPKTERDVRETLAWVMNRNLFGLNLRDVQQAALKHPWVAEATVHGQLPGILRVVLIERQPAGLVRLNNRIMVVGPDGAPICAFDEFGGPLDLPVLIGLGSEEKRTENILSGLAALDAVKRASLVFWDNIETLDMSDPENMVVRLRNEDAPLFLGGEVIPANLFNYLSIAEHLQKNYPRLAYIELGFPSQISVMPLSGEE